jgi:hypothetical protein
MKMSTFVKRTVSDVIHQDVVYRLSSAGALPNQVSNGVSDAAKLRTCWRWVIKKAHDQIRFEVQAARAGAEQVPVKLRRRASK